MSARNNLSAETEKRAGAILSRLGKTFVSSSTERSLAKSLTREIEEKITETNVRRLLRKRGWATSRTWMMAHGDEGTPQQSASESKTVGQQILERIDKLADELNNRFNAMQQQINEMSHKVGRLVSELTGEDEDVGKIWWGPPKGRDQFRPADADGLDAPSETLSHS